MNKRTISVVIPVYRAGETLVLLYRRLAAVLEECSSAFEVLFVEDCGGDNSWQVIQELSAQDPRVKGIKMSRNYGQHNALLAGIRDAQYDWLITFDDDLQHPPEEIPKLLAKLDEGFDAVYGPPLEAQHGLFRNLASLVTKVALQGAMGAETARHVSALRIFKTTLRDAFADYKSPSVNIDVVLTWATTNFGVCPVRHEARQYGESGYTTTKLIAHALNMMTGFSTIPLKLASIVGFLFAIFGVCILGFVVMRYIVTGGTVQGFTFLASIVAIFSGAQLLALGVIGEYLGRMHQRTMERPTYVIGSKVGDN